MVQIGDPRLPIRFWEKVKVIPSELLPTSCWQWTAALTPNGYAKFRIGSMKDGSRKTIGGHVLAYETLVSPVPHGLELDHLCRNHACVNPTHLEPVTTKENAKRGFSGMLQKSRTHCPKGHPYDEANTYVNPNGKRVCRICMKANSKLRYRSSK